MIARRWLGCGAIAAMAVLSLPAAPARAADKVSVSVLTFVSSAPLFIAQDRGHFAKEGLEVEIKFFAAAQPVAVAVTSGDVDFGTTGLTAGFFNLAGKGTLKIICAQSREEKGWEFNAYVASNQAYAAGLTGLDKLPGRNFGISTIGSSHHYMLGKLAEKRGFSRLSRAAANAFICVISRVIRNCKASLVPTSSQKLISRS